MSRIIVENGNVKCDTVEYRCFYNYIDNYTKEQLDSVREKVRMINQADSIRAATKLAAQEAEEAPRSIWDRIADWFRSVWKLLFG